MCGILGKFNFNGDSVERSILHKMGNTIAYRGPDDEGVFTGPFIGLGQRRLSIIDLSRKATAPLSNENKTVWVVCNGEIYNFKKLRSNLEVQGHTFRTDTDIEVIVHLYEEYGFDCLQYLRGMFSFALWDSRKKILFAARDRLGKKPFFYSKTPTSFVFGSEIKAITVDPSISRTPNYAAIDHYLCYQYVPSPLTAFSGISKIPPAHYLICDTFGEITISRYWEPPYQSKTSATPAENEQQLLSLLRESVRLRMIADVPVGAFLSGGIDSGAIVALMAMESSMPIQTFSIGFEQEEFNELPFAKTVANRYGTEHHEFIVSPSAVDILPELVRHYNEPFADVSALPTYYLSKMTKDYVTVALSGDGGDEGFAGYTHYNKILRWSKIDYLPLKLRHILTESLGNLLSPFNKTNTIAKISKALSMAGANLPGRYRQHMSIVKDQERDYLYTPKFKDLIDNSTTSKQIWSLPWDLEMDSLDWMMRHDQQHYLPDCLMVKTDIASMANSLEVRCPFLDHKLLEFAASIPSSQKTNGHEGKIILKNSLKNLLPEATLRKPKAGFGVPVGKWLKEDLSTMLKDILLDDIAAKRNLFNPSQVKRMAEEHISGARVWSNRLWALLLLELWFREFID